MKQSIQEQTKNSHTSILTYRNPIGKIITQIGSPDLSTYFFRRDNLIADRLLLQHALDVVSGKVAFNPTPTALHQANLLHPFTGKSPVWDETRRDLRFEPPDDLEVSGRHAPLVLRLPVVP